MSFLLPLAHSLPPIFYLSIFTCKFGPAIAPFPFLLWTLKTQGKIEKKRQTHRIVWVLSLIFEMKVFWIEGTEKKIEIDVSFKAWIYHWYQSHRISTHFEKHKKAGIFTSAVYLHLWLNPLTIKISLLSLEMKEQVISYQITTINKQSTLN